MVKFEVKSYKVFAVVSMVVDGEIKCESVTGAVSARDSRAAQKNIAAQYGVKTKDVNVLKIETVKSTFKVDADAATVTNALQAAGLEVMNA